MQVDLDLPSKSIRVSTTVSSELHLLELCELSDFAARIIIRNFVFKIGKIVFKILSVRKFVTDNM